MSEVKPIYKGIYVQRPKESDRRESNYAALSAAIEQISHADCRPDALIIIHYADARRHNSHE